MNTSEPDIRTKFPPEFSVMLCLHDAIVAVIGGATDRRDDRLVQTSYKFAVHQILMKFCAKLENAS